MKSTKDIATARLIPASADPAVTGQRVLFLFPGYLLLLIVAETLVALSSPKWGLIFYGLVLLLLLAHTILSWNQPFRYIPLILSLAPITRLLLLTVGLTDLSILYAGLSLAPPALGASGLAVYIVRQSQSPAQARSSPAIHNSSRHTGP
jgi:hypothetical protein